MSIHLVKLVDAADAVVGQHERAGLDDELGTFLVLDDSCRQTGGSTGLAGSVNGSRAEVSNLRIENILYVMGMSSLGQEQSSTKLCLDMIYWCNLFLSQTRLEG